MLYILNLYNACQLYFNKSGKNNRKKIITWSRFSPKSHLFCTLWFSKLNVNHFSPMSLRTSGSELQALGSWSSQGSGIADLAYIHFLSFLYSRAEHAIIEWYVLVMISYKSFPSGSDGKVSAFNVGDLGSIPGLGWSPGEGNGYPLRYSYLENPMDRGAW